MRKSVNRKKYRPYPLTTVQFQKLATDKLRMSAANAMKVAESLYQRGFISYPRTETNSFPPTINLQNLLGNLKNSSVYSSYIWSLLENNKFQKPKVGSASDQAHTPIHPVKLAEQNSLNAE